MQLKRYFCPTTNEGGGILDYEYGLVSTPGLYRDVFREMADSRNYPMICHCRLGADRAGTVVALLEALLGCSEQQMGENYIWTSLSVNGIRDTAFPEWRGVITHLKSFDKQDSTVQAGAWYYLLTQGLTVDELIAIRKTFTGDERQPFSAIELDSQGPVSRTSPRYVAKRYFMNSSPGFIIAGKGIGRLVLFSLSGRKIWEFNRKHSDREQEVTVPPTARGMGIIYRFGETRAP